MSISSIHFDYILYTAHAIVKNYDSVNSYENQIQNLRSFVHNIIPEKLYRYRKYNQDTIKQAFSDD